MNRNQLRANKSATSAYTELGLARLAWGADALSQLSSRQVRALNVLLQGNRRVW